ncbi:DUF4271 domain-containing protein [Hydrotalea sandarakina]|uniref:Uncharacterized protein DUF4271 n=1 Tax=Hydrotalea sandarakina TaxID=1004304 RepID=A0A2W7RPG3_9BACT|nr:DUF4271 domain-containing protein [Hydrotalea sandarakina]PZX62221.1 uncharacterized protein DUF4271 [Hydrotalea sandarakina]
MQRKAILFCCIYVLLVWVNAQAQTDTDKQLPVIQQLNSHRPALESTMVKPAAKKTKRTIIADSVKFSKVDTNNKKTIDTINTSQNNAVVKDSIAQLTTQTPAVKQIDTGTYAKWMPAPFLPFNQPPFYQITAYKKIIDKDDLFYVLCGVLFYLALLRQLFSKYFNSLFAYFFQTSYRQKQMREQMAQGQLSALLFNILFIVNGGLYAALVAQFYGISIASFWWIVLYSSILLVVIYGGKFVLLQSAGWIFGIKQAANQYIFIVLLINKVAAIFLIPIIWLLAFSTHTIAAIALQVSFGLLAFLWLYRFFISLSAFRRELKMNGLHFFLYICAVEIIPVLCLYRLMFLYLQK